MTQTQAATGGGQGDLLWVAAIKDETINFFRNFDKNMSALMRRNSEAFVDLQVGSKKSATTMGILSGAIAGITMRLATMGIQALQQFKQMVVGATQLAARAQTLAISLQVVGKNAGYTDEQLAEFEQAMKANGITTIKVRESLMKMAQANLDLAMATDLSRVAQDAAVIAGTNSSVAFGRMIHGITTLNPLVLRNMGIIVDATQEYEAYAAANGTAAKSMTYAMKQQIMANAVIKAGARVAGTYEAAMGTAGKQASSMARYQEELALAMGRVTQPAYMAWIQFLTRNLKEMQQWFEDNAEAVEELSINLGKAATAALALGEALGRGLVELGGAVGTTLGTLHQLAADIATLREEIGENETSLERFNVRLGEFTSIVVYGVVAGIAVMVEGWHMLRDAILVTVATIKVFAGAWDDVDYEESMARIEELRVAEKALIDDLLEGADRVRAKADPAFIKFADSLGLLKEAAEDAAPALEEVSDAMDIIAEETADAISAISELNDKMMKDFAEMAKKVARQDIDNAIRASRRRIDIYRRYEEDVIKIAKDAARRRADVLADAAQDERDLAAEQADERADAATDHARNLLDVELDYQRTLEDIQRRFVEDVDEAARRNDAVAVARLIRQKNRQLKEAGIARDRDEEDEKINYDRQLEDLRKSQQKQRDELLKAQRERLEDLQEDLARRLEEAEESRQQNLDSLERSLAEEKEDLERHRAWDAQDIREKYEDDIKALGEHMAEMQKIDETGLKYLLGLHGEFIEDDLLLWESYYASLRGLKYGAGPTTPSSYEEWNEGSYDPEKWGWAGGGVGLAMSPQTINVAESEPEVVAAIPLSSVTSHNFQFSDWNVNVNGVSPQTEAQIAPIMYDMMTQLAASLQAQIAGGVGQRG